MDRPSVLRQHKPLPTPNSQQKSILDSHPDFQIVCRIASKIPKSRIVDSFSCRHLSLAKYRKKSAGDCIKVKSRYVDLSSISSSKCSDMDHTVYLQTPWLPLDLFAFTRWCCHGLWWQHLVAAYYSFIDTKRMKGWVGLVGWPIDRQTDTQTALITYW